MWSPWSNSLCNLEDCCKCAIKAEVPWQVRHAHGWHYLNSLPERIHRNSQSTTLMPTSVPEGILEIFRCDSRVIASEEKNHWPVIMLLIQQQQKYRDEWRHRTLVPSSSRTSTPDVAKNSRPANQAGRAGTQDPKLSPSASGFATYTGMHWTYLPD